MDLSDLSNIQTFITVAGAFLTAALGIFKYFNYRSKRDRRAAVGEAFNLTVEGLSAESEAKQKAAAILLRRFFDKGTEQGASGTPYRREAVAVIAALLRGTENSELQKMLADGLAHAPTLYRADLQRCNLSGAYLGFRRELHTPGHKNRLRQSPTLRGWLQIYESHCERLKKIEGNAPVGTDKRERLVPIDLSSADLFQATLDDASINGAFAPKCIFYGARLKKTVLKNACLQHANFQDSYLEEADFRGADLANANFDGAYLAGARFQGALSIPESVRRLIGESGTVPPSTTDSVLPS
jgi:hypothetical protein